MIIFKLLASVCVDHGLGVVCAAVLSSDEVLSGSRISGAGARIKNGVAGTWRWCVLQYNTAPERQRVVAGGATGGGSGGQ